jgi:hypothetical protein
MMGLTQQFAIASQKKPRYMFLNNINILYEGTLKGLKLQIFVPEFFYAIQACIGR